MDRLLGQHTTRPPNFDQQLTNSKKTQALHPKVEHIKQFLGTERALFSTSEEQFHRLIPVDDDRVVLGADHVDQPTRCVLLRHVFLILLACQTCEQAIKKGRPVVSFMSNRTPLETASLSVYQVSISASM